MKRALCFGLLAAATVGLGLPAHAQTPTKEGRPPSYWPPGVAQPMTVQSAGQADAQATGATADPAELAKSIIKWGMGRAFEGLPDWAKRIEFNWDFGIGKSDFSLLTVQPLYRSSDWIDTVLTQVRAAWVENDAFTTNLGLGYRRLLLGELLLVGGNMFYDADWTDHHKRLGWGLELRSTAFELNSNYYKAITGMRKITQFIIERALDGYDVELGVQLPFLPWAHAFGRYGYWDGVESKNIHDNSASIRMRLFSFLEVEAGRFDDNVKDPDYFVSVRVSLGGTRGKAASEKLVDSQPWRLETMRDHTLNRVRRDNNIRVERITKAAPGAAAAGTITVSVRRK